MPLPRRRPIHAADQPALPLDVEAAEPTSARRQRSRARTREEPVVQLALDGWDETAPPADPPFVATESEPLEAVPCPGAAECEALAVEVEAPPLDVEASDSSADPFADIPGMEPAAGPGEYVLLPASLRGRLDLREFSRFLGTLPTVIRDWDGAPEVDDGGIRLRGPAGGAWIYPEASRVRLVTDGFTDGPLAEDLVALCRWLESRAGMRLYPAGETTSSGADRSLDPWETFGG